MSADLLVLVLAVLLPIVTLVVLARLIAGVGDLERSRDDLVELRIPKR